MNNSYREYYQVKYLSKNTMSREEYCHKKYERYSEYLKNKSLSDKLKFMFYITVDMSCFQRDLSSNKRVFKFIDSFVDSHELIEYLFSHDFLDNQIKELIEKEYDISYTCEHSLYSVSYDNYHDDRRTILSKLMYSHMYEYLEKNKLKSSRFIGRCLSDITSLIDYDKLDINDFYSYVSNYQHIMNEFHQYDLKKRLSDYIESTSSEFESNDSNESKHKQVEICVVTV